MLILRKKVYVIISYLLLIYKSNKSSLSHCSSILYMLFVTMAMWQHGSVGLWQCGSMLVTLWQHSSVTTWLWQCGSMAVAECSHVVCSRYIISWQQQPAHCTASYSSVSYRDVSDVNLPHERGMPSCSIPCAISKDGKCMAGACNSDWSSQAAQPH